jgi:hypothetical protein
MLDISWTDMRRPEVVSKPSLEFCLASTVNATLGRVVGRRDWLPNMWGMYRVFRSYTEDPSRLFVNIRVQPK